MPRLRKVSPATDLGFRRIRSGSGFRYTDADGAALPASERERIAALVIPPAWTEVWISAAPNGHIQATGVDEAGRMQYLYHPDWSAGRDKGKYARALQLAESLPRARSRVTTSLRRDDLDRERVLATAFRLLDQAAPRIGSAKYLTRHGSRGLTTLQRRDAVVADTVTSLRFPARAASGRVSTSTTPTSPRSSPCSPRGGARRPSRVRTSPAARSAHAEDVNVYVRTMTGGTFSAKDFRTLRGTILAAQALAEIGTSGTKNDRKHAEVLAVKTAAEALGNTPAVAKGSYIDPRVFARYRRGLLLDGSVSPESAIRALILG